MQVCLKWDFVKFFCTLLWIAMNMPLSICTLVFDLHSKTCFLGKNALDHGTKLLIELLGFCQIECKWTLDFQTQTSVAPCLLKRFASSSSFSVSFLCRINWRCFCYGSLGCNLEKDMELRALTLKWNLIIQTFVSFRDPESSVVDFGNSWTNFLEV
jgi:hypothetical protein